MNSSKSRQSAKAFKSVKSRLLRRLSRFCRLSRVSGVSQRSRRSRLTGMSFKRLKREKRLKRAMNLETLPTGKYAGGISRSGVAYVRTFAGRCRMRVARHKPFRARTTVRARYIRRPNYYLEIDSVRCKRQAGPPWPFRKGVLPCALFLKWRPLLIYCLFANILHICDGMKVATLLATLPFLKRFDAPMGELRKCSCAR